MYDNINNTFFINYKLNNNIYVHIANTTCACDACINIEGNRSI